MANIIFQKMVTGSSPNPHETGGQALIISVLFLSRFNKQESSSRKSFSLYTFKRNLRNLSFN